MVPTHESILGYVAGALGEQNIRDLIRAGHGNLTLMPPTPTSPKAGFNKQ